MFFKKNNNDIWFPSIFDKNQASNTFTTDISNYEDHYSSLYINYDLHYLAYPRGMVRIRHLNPGVSGRTQGRRRRGRRSSSSRGWSGSLQHRRTTLANLAQLQKNFQCPNPNKFFPKKPSRDATDCTGLRSTSSRNCHKS